MRGIALFLALLAPITTGMAIATMADRASAMTFGAQKHMPVVESTSLVTYYHWHVRPARTWHYHAPRAVLILPPASSAPVPPINNENPPRKHYFARW